MQSDDVRPVVASYVPVYCRPEMRHVHRQITGLTRWRAHVITQRRENAADFPLAAGAVSVLSKYRWRFFRRLWFTQLRHVPWEVSAGELREFRAVVAATGARLIHLYFGHMAMHWLPLLRSPPRPVVVSFHGADAGVDMAGGARRRMMAEVFDRATLVLGRSEALLADLAALGCPPGKLALNRTGIPLDEFFPVARDLPADGAWRLMQSGRLMAKKDYPSTLKVLAEVRKFHPRTRLLIAGEGPDRAALESLARDLGVDDAVDWLGFLSPSALRDALHRSHVFLHPSVVGPDGNREGVPNGLLEAMATGLPVVATRHGGIPEAVRHGESGLLAGEQDVGALTAAVLSLLAEPEMAARIGRQAAADVAAGFSRPSALAALEAHYDRAASAAGAV